MLNDFQAYYFCILLERIKKENPILPVLKSSTIEIYPHQIASATFALNKFDTYTNEPKEKGVILCDEGGLGKTYSTMLIIATRWYLGDEKILIVLPHQLIYEWIEVLENNFEIPYIAIGNSKQYEKIKEKEEQPFNRNAIIVTSYNTALKYEEEIKKVNFKITVFEEAHKLKNFHKENRLTKAMLGISKQSFKILLTATPIQNSILDLYSLVTFIDDNIFGIDYKNFYSKYYKNEENYLELKEKVMKLSFRTLKSEVRNYINIPHRLPLSILYKYEKEEDKLYKLVESYLKLENKKAFPKIEEYDLTLMVMKIFSSSTNGIKKTFEKISSRLEEDESIEKMYVEEIVKLSKKIKVDSKFKKLETILNNIFKNLKSKKINEKVVIFTQNIETMNYLYESLNKDSYKNKIIKFSSNNTNIDIKNEFKNKNKNKILITTDLASDGFNFSFASVVINYDLPYNILKIEQRVNRCHRLGQTVNTIIINFLNENNFYDVRILQLIKKRMLQFDKIMGYSEDFLGTFVKVDEAIKIIENIPTKKEVDESFLKKTNLLEDEVALAKNCLYTTFSKELRDKIVIVPKYIEEKTKFLDENIWQLVKYFFYDKKGFIIDEKGKSILVSINQKSPFIGTSMRSRKYSILDKSVSKACKINLTSNIIRNICNEIMWKGVHTKGRLILKNNNDEYKIALYKINIQTDKNFIGGDNFYQFVGLTKNSEVMNNKYCEKLLQKKAIKHYENDIIVGEHNRHLHNIKGFYDESINELINSVTKKYIEEVEVSTKKQILKEKNNVEYEKQQLVVEINKQRNKINDAKEKINNATNNIDKIKGMKQLNVMLKNLKIEEENLFRRKSEVEEKFRTNIKKIKDKENITTNTNLIFEIKIEKE